MGQVLDNDRVVDPCRIAEMLYFAYSVMNCPRGKKQQPEAWTRDVITRLRHVSPPPQCRRRASWHMRGQRGG